MPCLACPPSGDGWTYAGGWPKDVDFSEQADVTRFRKKAEKDDEYKVRASYTCTLIGLVVVGEVLPDL
jgi:hypothetical protein